MDLYRSALSLVIHKSGDVHEHDVKDLLSFYRENKGISIDEQAYERALASALEHYRREDRLYVCTDRPCLRESLINPSGKGLAELSSKWQIDVEATGCHWLCADAPVISLKHAEGQQTFTYCNSTVRLSEVETAINKCRQPREAPTT